MSRSITRRLVACVVAIAGIAAIPGCNFTTAIISSFVVSKDKEGAQTADKFNPHETIYAKVLVSNVPSKVTVKWRVIAVKVEGEKHSDGTSDYELSPPASGIPVGTYKIEAHMLTEGGDEKDLKSATITVAGG